MHPNRAKGEIYTMSTSTTTPSTVSTWNIDPAHSAAEFKVRHMMIAHVKGTIRGLKGVLTLNEADPTRSKVTASADLNTLNTGEPQRDGHLKSADFFEAEKYPELTFESTAVKRTGGEEFEVKGNLTIHGVTKPVTFAVEELGTPNKDPWGNLRVGVSATAKINRKDFGLTWNSQLETGGVLVGEEVTLTIDAQFIKAA
jgi:polyisoprenoid-binding protein YceI